MSISRTKGLITCFFLRLFIQAVVLEILATVFLCHRSHWLHLFVECPYTEDAQKAPELVRIKTMQISQSQPPVRNISLQPVWRT